MGINRLFLESLNSKVFGEEIKEKRDKVFDEILQGEHAKLEQLVSEMEKKWNTEDPCRNHDLMEKHHLPSSNE